MLLSYMVNEVEYLEPKLDKEGYKFPTLNKILGEKSISILEELVEKGILKHYLVDVEIICPKCNSSILKDKYVCPFCTSFNLERKTLIEHYACGAVDFLEKFIHDDKYVCPKCNKTLKLIGTDYRKIENIYICRECGKNFSLPNIVHKCLICNHAFNYEEAKLNQVFGYKLNEDLKNEIIVNSVIEDPLIKILKKEGYSTESFGTLLGISGVNHTFELIARKNSEVIAITIVSDVKEVGVDVVTSHFAKAYDAHPTKSMIIAFPKLSNEAKKLANLYAIDVIEGETIEEIKKRFERKISFQLNETLQIS
ncbi:MAG: restriction endonuclease [Candidatus Bathyarchaeia archaeon]